MRKYISPAFGWRIYRNVVPPQSIVVLPLACTKRHFPWNWYRLLNVSNKKNPTAPVIKLPAPEQNFHDEHDFFLVFSVLILRAGNSQAANSLIRPLSLFSIWRLTPLRNSQTEPRSPFFLSHQRSYTFMIRDIIGFGSSVPVNGQSFFSNCRTMWFPFPLYNSVVNNDSLQFLLKLWAQRCSTLVPETIVLGSGYVAVGINDFFLSSSSFRIWGDFPITFMVRLILIAAHSFTRFPLWKHYNLPGGI